MNEMDFLEFIYESAHQAAEVKVSGVPTLLRGSSETFSDLQWTQFATVMGSFGILERDGDFFSVWI